MELPSTRGDPLRLKNDHHMLAARGAAGVYTHPAAFGKIPLTVDRGGAAFIMRRSGLG